MDEMQYAFLDEFGDNRFNFNHEHVSTHFIVVSILLKDSNKEMVESKLEQIRDSYFHSGEFETHILEENPIQAIQLLNDIKDLPFSVWAYVIDKRKTREDFGIMHKTPFLKYVNRAIYDDLSLSFEQLDLVADDQEEKQFIGGFRKYIKTRNIPDLFDYSTFGFNNSQSDLLLQLAKLMIRILAENCDKTQYSEQYRSFFKIIKSRISAINLLPHDYKNFLVDFPTEKQNSRYDEVIIRQAVNLAYQYIEKHRKSEEEDERLRIDFLKFLLFNLKENPDEYVYTEEVLDNLNAIRDIKMNPHYFRSNIVSKLRDSGVIIASSKKGYKLPVCLNDLYDFVNLSSLTIHPMLQRIAKCRDQILETTNHEIDILEPKEYGYLKKIIEMEKMRI
ncbi:DUF3800 domain-containing protein [Neobacillus jeddahensis]|uniref:DUF3800 domain-containing protein n=1 Tax=Neobacillus jeddahensis TaxID=1461580 RepID=UPI00058CF754|nr:DUF3800 domain-containing protein [Neobacillus jeddahensis]